MNLDFHIHEDISQAQTPPGYFYYTPEIFEALRRKVFQQSWQWVASVHSVQESGSVFPFMLSPGMFDEPMVLIRNSEGQVNCLSNVCTHRGNILIDKPGKCSAIRCKYHGRRFDLDGKMEFMPGFEQVKHFPSPTENLAQLPLEEVASHYFTALNPSVSFDEWKAPLTQVTQGLPCEQFYFSSSRARKFNMNVNWALYVENYLEGFHIPFVHSHSLAPLININSYRTELFDRGVVQIAEPVAGQPEFVLPPASPYSGQRIGAFYVWLYPNIMFNFYPWGLSLNIVKPLGPEKTEVQFLPYVWKPELLEKGAGKDLDVVEYEDEEIVNKVQQGVKSSLYTRGRYSVEHERGPHFFHRLLVNDLFGE